jgi:hypothetical protein
MTTSYKRLLTGIVIASIGIGIPTTHGSMFIAVSGLFVGAGVALIFEDAALKYHSKNEKPKEVSA